MVAHQLTQPHDDPKTHTTEQTRAGKANASSTRWPQGDGREGRVYRASSLSAFVWG